MGKVFELIEVFAIIYFFMNVPVRCVVFNNRGVGGEELLVSTS